ncbi:MAG: hypothetical protein GY795_05770 [Desulfobacterales bacterium]|nr:hypothetical protein [Desulfobacterales bacterium]
MSLLNKQITDLIENKIEHRHGILNTEIKFDKKFIGFNGHFPGNPVLPGVVMIKVMIRMYEMHQKKEYILLQIKQAKFISPVSADTIISFSVKPDTDQNGIKLSGKILKSENVIAKISLALQEGSEYF